jgi:hypothetical protein
VRRAGLSVDAILPRWRILNPAANRQQPVGGAADSPRHHHTAGRLTGALATAAASVSGSYGKSQLDRLITGTIIAAGLAQLG